MKKHVLMLLTLVVLISNFGILSWAEEENNVDLLYDDTVKVDLKFENGTYLPLQLYGCIDESGVAYQDDAILGSKVTQLTRSMVSPSNSGLYHNLGAEKTGKIEASVKFLVDDVTTTRALPIALQVGGNGSVFSTVPTVYVLKEKFYIPSVIPGSTGVGKTEIADAKSDTWYEVELVFDIDGDTTTTDTFDYELYELGANKESTKIASGKDVYFGNALDSGTNRLQNAEGIQHIVFGGSLANYYTDKVGCGVIKVDDIYMKYAPINVTTSLGDTSREIKSVQEIEIDFNQYVLESTLEYIKLDILDPEADDITVIGNVLFTVEADGCKAILKFEDYLPGGTSFRLSIPETVRTQNGDKVVIENGAIFFETLEEEYEAPMDDSLEFTENFEDDINSLTKVYVEDGAEGGIVEDNTLNSNVWKFIRKGAPISPYSYYVSSSYYQFPKEHNGTITVSTKFKVENVNDMDFAPISVITNMQTCPFTYAFLFIRNGNFYENGGVNVVGPAEANVWYQLDVTISVDGDANTTDKFDYILKRLDGNLIDEASSIVENTNVPFHKNDWSGLSAVINQTSIDRFHFGMFSTYGKGYTDETENEKYFYAYMDDVSISKYLAPSVTASITDSEEDVDIDRAITLTFDQKVNAADFANITLTADGKDVEIGPTISEGYVNECTIQLTDSYLNYGTNYVLTIKNIRNQGNISIVTQKINFKTKLRSDDIQISNRVGSDTEYAEGDVITVSADFKNLCTVKENSAVLIIALYNDDDLYAKGFTTADIDGGETKNIQASLTVPEGFSATGASVKVFAWDGLDTMIPVSVLTE